ncbi:hypothetical protein CTM94_11285 [Photobacterium leiognathi]|uniref:DNA-directed DNA polymerase family A palm domain-containing protein n=2 Tax=Photobacterium leiognathi TaxID=553611 RepID=A0ABX5GFB8_PHOLE|nr:DNA polymerase [Photobacterium leiognathi]KJF90687.1 hypothetical protein UB42_07115 [Photobacterium leiognathi]PSV81661.1 hypothetical protein CTM94_11285 [Photobacterium leiognathi]
MAHSRILKSATVDTYLLSLSKREPVRIEPLFLNKLINNIGRLNNVGLDKGKINAAIMKLRQLSCSIPNCKPFYTKTGRETYIGASITQINKKLWPYFVKPEFGFAYVLFDYSQQEPAISAVKSNDIDLLNIYKESDIYEFLNNEVTSNKFDRKKFKKIFLPYFYGAEDEAIIELVHVSKDELLEYRRKLDFKLRKVNQWLDRTAWNAYANGYIRSLDLELEVDKNTPVLMLRNWLVQASGADISRRVCVELYKRKIPLLLTVYDAFLVKIELSKYEEQIKQVKDALSLASSQVLDGFSLNTNIELIIK